MALIKQEQQTEQKSFKRNPIIDEQLNDFIQKNEALVNYIKDLPRERLERKYLLTEMNAQKQQQGYDEKVLNYINNPQNAQFKQIIMEGIPQDLQGPEREKKILQESKVRIRNTGLKIG